MNKPRILLVLVLGMVASACGGGSGDSGQARESTTTDDSITDTTGAMTDDGADTSVGGEPDVVRVAESDLGEILVGPDGLTLYVFTVDTEETSTCYDACAELWPPVPADVPISSDLDELQFGTIPRDDGTDQLAINGMPLYWYAPDESPGDTRGQAFNDVWFVVDPEGEMVESSAVGSDNPVIDYDY